MNQIKIHKKIDLFLTSPSKEIDIAEWKHLLSQNFDARNYLFFKADECWVDWFWKHGFLDVIKQKPDDSGQNLYRMPELFYLARMVDKVPCKVVKILLNIPINKENFNPEVVDQFLRICSDLPAKELVKIIPKIYSENWVRLFNSRIFEFEYQQIFNKLLGDKEYSSILLLSDIILSIKTKEELSKENGETNFESPFYINDLSYTNVFQSLISVGDEWVEKTIELVLDKMKEIVLLGKKTEEGSCFKIEDLFYLYNLDFFTAEITRGHSTYRESMYELSAVISKLTVRLINLNKDNKEKLEDIYDKFIRPLPDSRLVWHLRLYIMSLAPEAYKDIIYSAIFRLFETDDYSEITSGAEYKKLLQKAFYVLSEEERNEYAEDVISYFLDAIKKEADKDKSYAELRGSEILSIISKFIDLQIVKKAKKAGFKINLKVKPRPSIGPVISGSVVDQSPVDQEALNKLTIEEICKNLKEEWSPESLVEKFKTDDFFNRRNAEGLARAIQENIKGRLLEYVDNSVLFFDPEKIDLHYTYSFVRGIQDMIKNNRDSIAKTDWNNFFEFCFIVIDYCKKEEFTKEQREREVHHGWLAGWDAVHTGIVDTIQELIKDEGDKYSGFFDRYRYQYLSIIEFMLGYPDPEPKDEEIETASSTTKSPGDKNAYIQDPFMMAINSVRGRAFEALVSFSYQDGKKYAKKDAIKISEDVKQIYENTLLQEKTRAIRFMFGRYIPSFYYRDKDWIYKLLPEIFPSDSEKKYLYISAWEGYLSNNLYTEIFFDQLFEQLYERGLDIEDSSLPSQKHFKDPDEGLAVHLALAYIFFKDFDQNQKLFKKFWSKDIPKQHADFINFIGRSFISGNNSGMDKHLSEERWPRERIKELWDWMLDNYFNEDIFIQFGFWVNLEKEIFDVVWLAKRVRKTLEKTGGVLEWEHGLSKSISCIAKEVPEEALKIIKLFLLENIVRQKNGNRFPLEDEWFEALKAIYQHTDNATKTDIYQLINNLILEGGSSFWKFEEIVKEGIDDANIKI